MRVFKELRTDGYVFFGKTKLDLDYKGVTVIQAANLDARKDDSSTNGAGKSLLVGLIPEIFYDTTPTGKDVKVKGSQARRAGGVTVKVKDTVYDLDRVWGAKKSFTIAKNGQDVNARTLAIAGEKAKQIIGLSEEEFYTTAYIDVNRVHPLIRGTSAQRQAYFTSMFRLQDVDNLRKLLLSELRDAETAGTTYKELVAQFEGLRGTTSASALKALEAERKDLKALALKFIDLSGKYAEVKEVIDFEAENRKHLAKVKEICEVSEVDSTLIELKARLKKKRKALEQITEYEHERRLIKKAKKANEKALEKLRVFGLTTDAEAAERGHRKLESVETNLTKARADFANIATQIKNLEYKRDPLYQAGIKPKFDEEKLGIYEARYQRLKHELDHAKQFKKGKCPTCGSEVKARPIEEIREDVRAVKAKIEKQEQGRELKALVDQLEGLDEPYTTLKAEIAKLSKNLLEYEKLASAHKTLSKLETVPKATVDKPDYDRETVEKQIEGLERKIEVLVQVGDAKMLYEAADKLSKEEREWATRTSEKLKVQEKKAGQLVVVEAKLETEAQKLKDLRRLRDRALEIKDKARDVPVIKALLEVYSNKGLKKLMIQRYAAAIEANLNKFRSVMFSEDFTFEIVYDTQFHILCRRRYGKRIVVSDVRKLSGAEGRGFALLLLLATLTLIPSSRRLNFLVLDEADSNMGPDMLINFQRFIPILNKVIPHILVVTPKKDVQYDGARYFKVVKQNGRSKLIKRST